MERTIIIRLITFNLIIASLIILDLLIPGAESNLKELSSFYSSTTNNGTTRKPIMETNGDVELLSGEVYRIGKLPERDYKKGAKIKIVKSFIAKNVNEVIIWDNGWKKLNVGIFSNKILVFSLAISILTSVSSIFYSNKGLNIGLIASMMFITIISFVYFISY